MKSSMTFIQANRCIERERYFKSSEIKRLKEFALALSFNLSLKLTCHQINRSHICLNIKCISVQPLLWMHVMLDFMCMVFAELLSTGYEWKIQKSTMYASCGNRTSDLLLSSVSLLPLGYWRHVNKNLQYLFTLRYYKNSVWCAKGYIENKNTKIVYLQFRDWYNLNTRWFAQKKRIYYVLYVKDYI